VHNDWEAFIALLDHIDSALVNAGQSVSIFAVDDGSTEPAPSILTRDSSVVTRVEVVELATNLGQQRAIAVGLVEASSYQFDNVVVMDADGEDRPEDIPILLASSREKPNQIIVAERSKRSEGFGFRLFYLIYRVIFLLSTASRIRHGNFCLIPGTRLHAIVHDPRTWNNLAASITRSRIPYSGIPTARGTRYAGRSKMNFISLFLHGLSAISVYLDVVAARIVAGSLAILGFLFLLALCIVGIRLFTSLAIPGWATFTLGLLAILMVQVLMFSGSILFSFLADRERSSVMPKTIAPTYVARRRELMRQPAARQDRAHGRG
jgi:glycosyltransferase involved in cell wall biosynthesis